MCRWKRSAAVLLLRSRLPLRTQGGSRSESACAGCRRRGLSSPMPGTIMSIDVKVGQAVKKGDILVILEAMKMENEIMAPHDATVAAVHVNKGDSVESGTALVSLQ